MSSEGWGGSSDPFARYRDLEELRSSEAADGRRFIDAIVEAIGDTYSFANLVKLGESADAKDFPYAVDLGSQSGCLVGILQDAFPLLKFIPTDVTYAEPGSPWGMALLKDTLMRLRDDHQHREVVAKRQSGGEMDACAEHQFKAMIHEKLLERAVEVDVLKPRWDALAHVEGKCALVMATMIMHQKAFETPEMWRQTIVGAARLLQPGGALIFYDQALGTSGFEKRDQVMALGGAVGLELYKHEKVEDGKPGGSGIFKVILKKTGSNSEAIETPRDSEAVGEENCKKPRCTTKMGKMETGHVVEVFGLKGRADLNCQTAVLGKFIASKERWECRVSAGVTARRHVEEVLIRRENLKSLVDQ